MSLKDIELPSPAWKLKEISVSSAATMVIYQYATFRTNEELIIWRDDDGRYVAYTTGTEGATVTQRLTQERWAQLYDKAIAAKTLLGKLPSNMIEEIF